jgi:hypothetical protein
MTVPFGGGRTCEEASPAGFTLTATNSGGGCVLPGGAAAFNLMLTTGSGTTYPDALALSATGLPAGATATFSPAKFPAGNGPTPVTITIQTIHPQTAHSEVAATTLARVAGPIERERSMIRACRRGSRGDFL